MKLSNDRKKVSRSCLFLVVYFILIRRFDFLLDLKRASPILASLEYLILISIFKTVKERAAIWTYFLLVVFHKFCNSLFRPWNWKSLLQSAVKNTICIRKYLILTLKKSWIPKKWKILFFVLRLSFYSQKPFLKNGPRPFLFWKHNFLPKKVPPFENLQYEWLSLFNLILLRKIMTAFNRH